MKKIISKLLNKNESYPLFILSVLVLLLIIFGFQISDLKALSYFGEGGKLYAEGTIEGIKDNPALILPNATRVGIGTGSPTALLHLEQQSGELVLRLKNNAGRNWEINSKPTSGGNGLFSIIDRTSNADRFVINANGNVGIGTVSPSAKLYVSGTVAFTGLATGVTPLSNQNEYLATVEFVKTYADAKMSQIPSQPPFQCGQTVSDSQGNTYGTRQVGSQCWMTENMRVGSMLASGSTAPNPNNGYVEKWCYDNNPTNCTTYGALYSWDEAMQGSTTPGARGICPVGWHIPTDDELTTLGNNLVSIASNRPGYLDFTYASFWDIQDTMRLWSSTPSGTSAWRRTISTVNFVTRGTDYKIHGFSVRCLKD